MQKWLYLGCNIPSHLTNTVVEVHSSTTEGSLFSGCKAFSPSPHMCTQPCMRPHTPGLVFWFPGLPYCTLTVFNKWSSVYLSVCVCVDSSVSPPSGFMSQPAWHYSALLIAHRHLRSSRETHTNLCLVLLGEIICTDLHPHMFVMGVEMCSTLGPQGSLTGRREGLEGLPIPLPLQAAAG